MAVDRPLAVKEAAGEVYRIARAPDPWAWADWAYAGPDGTFDNRWDDPEGIYRVLYASSQRAGAFVETLARYRVDLAMIAEMERIVEDDPADAPIPAGTVPREWSKGRLLGRAVLTGEFADVTRAKSLKYLREHLAAPLLDLGLKDLDAASVRTMDRSVTQMMSRLIYECSVDEKRAYDGVAYRSRLGDDYENWGVFETDVPGLASPVSVLARETIRENDPALLEALAYLGLRLEQDPALVERVATAVGDSAGG